MEERAPRLELRQRGRHRRAPTGCCETSWGSGWVEGRRRAWKRQGRWRGMRRWRAATPDVPAFQAIIDPNAPAFPNPADMPGGNSAFCHRTGQDAAELQAPGSVMRCVLESLARPIALAPERTEALNRLSLPGLHVVACGTRNETLLHFTADAIGRPV